MKLLVDHRQVSETFHPLIIYSVGGCLETLDWKLHITFVDITFASNNIFCDPWSGRISFQISAFISEWQVCPASISLRSVGQVQRQWYSVYKHQASINANNIRSCHCTGFVVPSKVAVLAHPVWGKIFKKYRKWWNQWRMYPGDCKHWQKTLMLWYCTSRGVFAMWDWVNKKRKQEFTLDCEFCWARLGSLFWKGT